MRVCFYTHLCVCMCAHECVCVCVARESVCHKIKIEWSVNQSTVFSETYIHWNAFVIGFVSVVLVFISIFSSFQLFICLFIIVSDSRFQKFVFNKKPNFIFISVDQFLFHSRFISFYFSVSYIFCACVCVSLECIFFYLLLVPLFIIWISSFIHSFILK